MNPSPSPATTSFYGWKTLVGVMITYAGLCGDLTYAYGVFLPAMGETFGWSRSALSGPYITFLIVGGILGPLAGMSVARFGARKIVVAANLAATLGMLGMASVGEVWHLHLCFGVLGGLGIGFGEFIPLTTIVNSWFIRKRSLAMGLLFASGGVGGFLLPPLISSLITGWGWRWAWVALAAIHLVLTVILGGLIIRSRPEDMGQVPDGHAGIFAGIGAGAPLVRRVYHTPTDWTLGEALRSPVLWMIVALFSIILFVTNMLTTHQVAYLQDLHFSPLVSATALGLMLGMSILGRIVCGLLGMQFEGRRLAFVFLLCMGLGVLSLLSARSVGFVYAYSILTGVGFGGMIVLMPNLMGAYFGRTSYSQIVGWTTPVVMLLSAISPWLAGMLYDRTGQYLLPFATAMGLVVVGLMVAALAKPPQPRQEGDSGAERP